MSNGNLKISVSARKAGKQPMHHSENCRKYYNESDVGDAEKWRRRHRRGGQLAAQWREISVEKRRLRNGSASASVRKYSLSGETVGWGSYQWRNSSPAAAIGEIAKMSAA
jgi:hypothetical protein